MVGGFRAGLVCVVTATLASAFLDGRAAATTIYLSDFDDTLVETREAFGGTFKTGFKLFRIDYRATTLQPVYDGPAVVTVSPVDLHRIKRYLATGATRPGAINRKVRLEDGQAIVPGYYLIRSPDTFEYFFTGPPGVNYLLRDFQEAEAREPRDAFQGQLWPTMQKILSDPEGADSFGVISARGHSLDEWRELFEYFRVRGYIEHLPNFQLFHGVSLPEYDQFSLRKDVPVQKVRVLEEIARKLSRSPLGARDVRLHPNGRETAAYHYLVFADDKQETLDLAARLFQNLARSQVTKVKFGLFNMGNRTEVTESQRPQYSIVQPDGTFRHATEDEIEGEPRARRGYLTGEPGCEAKLAAES